MIPHAKRGAITIFIHGFGIHKHFIGHREDGTEEEKPST
jgi:hypothetical protein